VYLISPVDTTKRLLLGREVVVLHMDSETLLDVRPEVAQRTLELAVALVVAVVPVQVPFVGGAKVAEIALDHGHRVILDVLGEARLQVGHVVALGAPEELLLQVRDRLVALHQRHAVRLERTHRALELLALLVASGGGGIVARLLRHVHHVVHVAFFLQHRRLHVVHLV